MKNRRQDLDAFVRGQAMRRRMQQTRVVVTEANGGANELDGASFYSVPRRSFN